MNLTELHPRWVVEHEYGEYDEQLKTAPKRHGMGISFLCPHCKEARLAVMFENPVDGFRPPYVKQNLWKRSGESFENMTLTPSIDASECGHWHGHITNGQIS